MSPKGTKTGIWTGGAFSEATTTGTVSVDVNQASATWTLYGPGGTETGTGDESFADVATGAYYVVFDALSGYLAPSIATGNLTDGGSITLTGTYIELASSFYSKRLKGLETLLSNCPTWQSWTGSNNASEARDHIYIPTNLDPEGSDTPFAIINYNDMPSRSTADETWENQSQFYLMIFNTPSGATDRLKYFDTLDRVGLLVEDLQNYEGDEIGGVPMVNLSDIRLEVGPLFESNVQEAIGVNRMVTVLMVDIGV